MRGRPAALLGAAVVLAIGVVSVVVVGTAGGASAAIRQQVLRVPVGAGADGGAVSLDATLFLPSQRTPAPAVVLAHGFGGSKTDETPDALALARHGYVVLAYSARGFGASDGQISLDAPQFEVRDAQRMIDLLAERPEVLRDGPGDPRVGFAGASYGGALALLVAGYDPRVDAIAPAITWNDLQQSLIPQSAAGMSAAAPTGTVGVFKRLWAGLFFSTGSLGPLAGPGEPAAADVPTTCGRFAKDVCAAYQQTAATGQPTPAILALLRRSSPATIVDRIKAPTLLLQGEADSLFPLSQASANASGIAARGTPVKLVWYGGGHDGGVPESGRLRALTTSWFDHWLKRAPGSRADTRFEASITSPAIGRDTPAAVAVEAAPSPPARVGPEAAFAGVGGGAGAGPAGAAAAGGPGRPRVGVPLFGPGQTILAPAGGTPAAITSLPGFGSALSLLSAAGPRLDALPGQSAAFTSAPLPTAVRLLGTPTVEVQVRSSTGDATLFAKLYDATPGSATPGARGGRGTSGTGGLTGGGGQGGAVGAAIGGVGATLPEQLVAPIHLTGLPGTGRTIPVALPTLVHTFPAGHLIVLVISTTDQGYSLPADARSYQVSLAGTGQVTLPTLATVPVAGNGSNAVELAAIILGAVLLTAFAGSIGWGRRRRAHLHPEPDLALTPLALRGVGKAFPGGVRAASEVSFAVQPGQVLGLLGPNGAGKTTVLRMLMGLLRPTEGDLFVFGHRVTPGAPVLSRIGSFIEGPGFLPHLSGRENLTLFWRATGRPAHDAHLDEALAIAGLGTDIERTVRTYSQGMRQRLALAQAMLGQPELLVLDEPTNGLDPPQIREMRDVLRSYASNGRTVVISSHLLAEVELTCTHAVVMHHGKVVAAGPVSDLIGTVSVLAVDVDDPAGAALVARSVPGVDDVTVGDASDGGNRDGLTVRVDPAARGELIRALVLAGFAVNRVAPARGLEQAFLTLVGQD